MFEGDLQMKIMRNAFVSLALILLSAPVIHGQDLSKYRNFSLGMSLADLSKQINEQSTDVNVLHQRPALIQELMWSPPQPSESSSPTEPVREILFTFYNGELYRMVLTYENSATEGMTVEDMIKAVSAKYGTATRPAGEIKFGPNENYGTTEKVIARWEDSQYSFILFRSALSHTFGLVLFSKQLNAQAEAAAAEAVKLERQEAPQKEVARLKKDADNLEEARLKNRKTFRP
jgi:hypothetical protein